jgi:uncharacterized protein (DUF1697 family)
MAELRTLAEDLGFKAVKTLLASGNLIFTATGDEAKVKVMLEAALQARSGAKASVMVRTCAELRAILASNPFSLEDPARTHVVLLDAAPPEDLWAHAKGRADEAVAPGLREIYIHYPQGQGLSKLRLPVAAPGTARNINTISKLAALLGEDG